MRAGFLSAALLLLIILGKLCIQFLNHYELSQSFSAVQVILVLFCLFLPIILAWVGYAIASWTLAVPIAIFYSILSAWVMRNGSVLWFAVGQASLCFLFYYMDRRKKIEIIIRNVDIEKMVNEKNDLEVSFQEEGMSISVYFEKYSSYYNLRNLATDFSTTLSLRDLAHMIVTRTSELIPFTESCLLHLGGMDGEDLSLIAAKGKTGSEKAKKGNLFDFWVIRNRKSLIVSDTERDFRFDVQKPQMSEVVGLRSVIASPLIHQGRFVGTLRLNAAKANRFNTDDLRLLDAIATLASSAVSNCLLYQRTVDLAIHDSLTGLYVHRHFMDRLKEEHGRSLITKSPLSFLMCDLDHFKQCNDQYGHAVGDLILVKTSNVLKEVVRHGIVARYGGEEFAILCPKIARDEALRMAESIRRSIEETEILIRREKVLTTISIGISVFPDDTLDAEELIRIADNRLYQAKAGGRNRICGSG